MGIDAAPIGGGGGGGGGGRAGVMMTLSLEKKSA